MFTNLATYSLPQEEEIASRGWLATDAYEEKYAAPTSSYILVALEILIGVSALSLLVLTQQTWPEGFWLNHTAVFISSSVVTSLVGLDVLISMGIKIYSCSLSTKSQPVIATDHQQWVDLRLDSKIPQFSKDENGVPTIFCRALAHAGLNTGDYELIIFRKAHISSPGLFTFDGAAPGVTLGNEPNDNPKNLRNYKPNCILVVTYFVGKGEFNHYESTVSENPCCSDDGNAESMYLGDQYVHVHLNQHDVMTLHEEIRLSPKVIDVIRHKRNFASTRKMADKSSETGLVGGPAGSAVLLGSGKGVGGMVDAAAHDDDVAKLL